MYVCIYIYIYIYIYASARRGARAARAPRAAAGLRTTGSRVNIIYDFRQATTSANTPNKN